MRSAARKLAAFWIAALALASCATGPARESEPTDEHAVSEGIRREIGSRLGQFEPCYGLAIDAYPGAAGKMVVRFLLRADGTVTEAEVKSAHPSLEAGEDCVLAHVRELRFPARPGGEEIEVIYPFFFTENGRLPAR